MSSVKMEQYLKRLLNSVGTTGAFTIVKSGLVNGDEIVVDGLTKVKNGAKVQATELSKTQIETAKQ